MTALADRVSMTVDRAEFDDLVTIVTQAPTWEKDRLPGSASCCARSAREGGRAGADPGALDVEARPRDAQGAGPARERRVPGGEAAARRARELARPPPRGERSQARQRRARAAARRSARRCSRPPRATRRAHAADRGGARAARGRSPRSRTRWPRTCPRRRRSRYARRAGGAEAPPRRAQRRNSSSGGAEAADGERVGAPPEKDRDRSPAPSAVARGHSPRDAAEAPAD